MKSTKRSTVLGRLTRKVSAATRSVRTLRVLPISKLASQTRNRVRTTRRASSSRASSARGKKWGRDERRVAAHKNILGEAAPKTRPSRPWPGYVTISM